MCVFFVAIVHIINHGVQKTLYMISHFSKVVNLFTKVFLKNAKKHLTINTLSVIIVKQCVGTHGRICRNGGIGRRPGLKIP